MRVLITGSNGLLGTKLLERLLAEPGVEPLGASRAACANRYLGDFPFWQVDVADTSRVEHLFQEAQPEIILHTAAMTDVDGCERDPEGAWRLNVEAARLVAEAAARHGARLVHLSTEYVFDGREGPYAEDDPPNPISVYGRTKYQGELAVRAAAPDAAVARTTVLFGYAPHVRPNFATWLVARLRSGEPARVVTDQVGSPTLADNLAEMVWALGRDRGARGVFNTVGATVMDRFSFARVLAEVFGLEARLIEPTDTPSLRQPAPRPLRGGLKMERFCTRYPDVPVLTTRAALERLRDQMATLAPYP